MLGPLLLERSGVEVTPTSALQRRLVTMLAVRAPERVPVDQLVDAAWPTQSIPRRPRENLHTHVSRLRRIVGSAIETTSNGYRLDTSEIWLDLAALDDATVDGITNLDDPELLGRLDRALELWRGPSLHDIADIDAGRADAARLDELRLSVVEARFETMTAHGRGAAIAHELDAHTRQHPYRERPHGLLMTVYNGLGRQADALRTFTRLRSTLVDELGIEPSPELRTLHHDLLVQQMPTLPGPSRNIARPSTTTAVPTAVTAMIGRIDDLERLDQLQHRSRLISIVGPGGVGKTRFAIEAANRWEAPQRDGADGNATAQGRDDADDPTAVWVDLTAATDAADVVELVGNAVGARRDPTQSMFEAIVGEMAHAPTLLVIDNCERVVEAVAEFVEGVLAIVPRCRVMTTSRSPLDLAGEQLIRLSPLSVDTPMSNDGVPGGGADRVGDDGASPHAPAVQLFLDRAGAAAADLNDDDETIELVAAICRSVDGLPLGIELAAAQLRTLSLAELERRIDHEIAVIDLSRRRSADRHRSIRTTLEWTYRTLPPDHQQLFCALSVFTGSFEPAAVAAVTNPSRKASNRAGHPTEDLRALADLSLLSVERVGGPTRYRLLSTARAFGLDVLKRHNAEASHISRLDGWIRQLADDCGQQLRGPVEGEAVLRIDAEMDNLRAAHRRATNKGDVDTALGMCCSLGEFTVHHLREDLLEWTFSAAAMPSAQEHALFGEALAITALGATNRGDLHDASDRAHEALRRSHPVSVAATQAHHALALVALYSGALDEAIDASTQLRQIATALDDPLGCQRACLVSALACLYRGDLRASRSWAERSQEHAQMTGAPSARAWALYALAEVEARTDSQRAAQLLEHAIAEGESAHNPVVIGVARISLSALSSPSIALDPVLQGSGSKDGGAVELATFHQLIRRWQVVGDPIHLWATFERLPHALHRASLHVEAAVLIGALMSSRTARARLDPVGTPFEALTEELVEALGERPFGEHTRLGSTMSQADVVDLALAATRLDSGEAPDRARPRGSD